MLSTRFPASDPHHVHLAEEDPILIEKMVRFIYAFDHSAITTKGSIRVDEVEPKWLPGPHFHVWPWRYLWAFAPSDRVAAGLPALVEAIKVVYTQPWPENDRGLRDRVMQHVSRNPTYDAWLLRVRRTCRGGSLNLWRRHFGEGVLGGG